MHDYTDKWTANVKHQVSGFRFQVVQPSIYWDAYRLCVGVEKKMKSVVSEKKRNKEDRDQ